MSVRVWQTVGSALLCLQASLNAELIVVDAAGGGQFADLGAAVAMAADGDVLLVRSGTYAGFTVDDKELHIIADNTQGVNIFDRVVVRNLSAAKTLSLAQLNLLGDITSTAPGVPREALFLENNAGGVRLQNCRLSAGYSPAGFDPPCDATPEEGASGLLIEDCADVLLVDSVAAGGSGGGGGPIEGCDKPAAGASGGPGMRVLQSNVAVQGSTFFGGDGGGAACSAGEGGAALRMESGELWLVGELWGGTGGSAFGPECGCHAGEGGVALQALGGLVHILDSDLQPGPGGNSALCGSAPDGIAMEANVPPVALNGQRRTLGAPAIVYGHETAALAFGGQSNEIVLFVLSADSLRQPFAPEIGLLFPYLAAVTPLGSTAADGTLTLSVAIPALPPGLTGATFYSQAAFISPAGSLRLSNSLVHAWL